MRAEKVLMALLSANSGVTALVGSQIYPTLISQAATYPVVQYHKISGVREPHLDATAGQNLVSSRIQVTSYAKTYAEVKSLAEAIRQALIYKSGLIAGVQVVAVLFDLEGPDQYDESNHIYYQPLDFLFTHYE